MTESPRRRSVWGITSLLLAVLAVLLLALVGVPHVTRPMLGISAAVLAGLVVWAIAQSRSDRRAWKAALALREQEIAHASQRIAIASDLHDIVSHGLGMITLRAQAARLDPDPAGPEQALADIEAMSRRATNELRHMLAALRAPGAAPLAPSPTLADLPALVGASGDSGLEVTLTGERTPVSPGVGVALYRVTQEALANAARHAGPTAVRVTAWRDEGTARLEILDAGPRPGWEAWPGTGAGLETMRRRVETMGGRFEAGPHENGFRVLAVIPDEVA